MRYVDTTTNDLYIILSRETENGLDYYKLKRLRDNEVVIRTYNEFCESFKSLGDSEEATSNNMVDKVEVGDKIYIDTDEIGECYVINVTESDISVINDKAVANVQKPLHVNLIERKGLFRAIDEADNISVHINNISASEEAKSTVMNDLDKYSKLACVAYCCDNIIDSASKIGYDITNLINNLSTSNIKEILSQVKSIRERALEAKYMINIVKDM